MNKIDAPELVRRAQELVQDDLLDQVFEVIEATHTEKWKSANQNDPETRENAWLMVRAIQLLKAEIKAVADGGLVDAHNRRLRQTQL